MRVEVDPENSKNLIFSFRQAHLAQKVSTAEPLNVDSQEWNLWSGRMSKHFLSMKSLYIVGGVLTVL